MTLALLVAHIGSGYLKHKMGKVSKYLASTLILVSTIDIAVYAIGLLVLLESLGISISLLLTALGIGGLATALALQDTLANQPVFRHQHASVQAGENRELCSAFYRGCRAHRGYELTEHDYQDDHGKYDHCPESEDRIFGHHQLCTAVRCLLHSDSAR